MLRLLLLSHSYRAFHGFGQAKFGHSGLVFGLSQFYALPQLPQKIMLSSKNGSNQLKK
jgi:hypothetical protein